MSLNDCHRSRARRQAHRLPGVSGLLLATGVVGCAQLVGADFDVHRDSPSQAGAGGQMATGAVSGNQGAASGAEGGQAGLAGDASEPLGGDGGKDSNDGDLGASGDGGAPNEAHGCDMPAGETSACHNCGKLVALPSGDQVCDCPSGTWGETCELVSKAIAVDAHSNQACVIRSDDTVACWGFDYDNPAPAELKFREVSAGVAHMCAIDGADSVKCWGNLSIVNWIPAGAFSSVASYGNQTCVLSKRGLPTCMGYGVQPLSEPLHQIQPVQDFGCGLHPDGTLECWGDTSRLPPVPEGPFTRIAAAAYELCGITPEHELQCTASEHFGEPPPGSFKEVALGAFHGCGILTNDELQCWGDSLFGQATAPEGRFKSLALAAESSCGVRDDGSVICWGQMARTHQPGAPAGVFTAAEITSANTCALRADKTVTCWGFEHVPPTGTFEQVSAGWEHGCGVRTDGQLACWGENTEGQTDAPEGTFERVSSGNFFSCALTTEGKAQCWGLNFYQPLEIPTDSLIDLSVGPKHACGLRKEDHTIVCWGQQGDGLLAAPEGRYKRVYASAVHSCALRESDSTAVCWGTSDPELDRGQLDPIYDDYQYIDLALGQTYSCGLRKEDGGVDCWGEGMWGAAYGMEGPFIDIDAGQHTTCGLHPNGRLECWGHDKRPLQ